MLVNATLCLYTKHVQIGHKSIALNKLLKILSRKSTSAISDKDLSMLACNYIQTGIKLIGIDPVLFEHK